jgi:hypothetical protein
MIRYHGMPLSGRDTTAVKCMQGKHACISYSDIQPLNLCLELCQSVMIDNGAYTTWKSGKEFNIEGYARLILQYYRHPALSFYLIPDSIIGADRENNILRAQWRDMVPGDAYAMGVPVWHLHETIETLEYLALAYPRVAIGSSGQYSEIGTQLWWARMAEAMGAVCDDQGRPKCKLHGLRQLDNTICSHIPYASADSTNVAKNISMDSAWRGTYVPYSKSTRAIVMMERIESHASASRWANTNGITKNMELFG